MLAKGLAYGDRRCSRDRGGTCARASIAVSRRTDGGNGCARCRRLTQLIEQLRQRTTIVVIEHDMPFLFRIADRISVIQWGQVIAQGTPAELRADPWVARSNLGAVAA